MRRSYPDLNNYPSNMNNRQPFPTRESYIPNKIMMRNTRSESYNNVKFEPNVSAPSTSDNYNIQYFGVSSNSNVHASSDLGPNIMNKQKLQYQESSMKFQNSRDTQNVIPSLFEISKLDNKGERFSSFHENKNQINTKQKTNKGYMYLKENLNHNNVIRKSDVSTKSNTVGNVSHNENGIGTATTITKNSKNVANKQETDDRLFILTGTVSKIMQWNNILKNHSCYFELIGTVVSLENGTVETQKIMLLRERTGPVLQVVYYQLTHIDVDDFHLGKVIRCVGRMIGHNVLHAFCIRGASTEEMENLQRLTLISEHAVSLHLKNEV